MASVAYISASVNRYSQAADSSPSSLLAFGSFKLIALWDIADPCQRGVFQTLPGHEGLVTCVRFVRDDFFISGDDTGMLRCWRKLGSQWTSTANVQAHNKAISSLYFHGQVLATGSSDASVKIWTCTRGDSSDKVDEDQILPLHGRYPLSLALANLPQSEAVILAIGGTDRNIHIWTRSEDVFVPSVVLSGHEDWVRSLAFRVSSHQAERLILASGSQDATIRLWKIEPVSRFDDQAKDLLSDELLDEFETSMVSLSNGEEDGRQISLRCSIFTVKDQKGLHRFSIIFDALLVGHEAGITSLRWRPTDGLTLTPTLLSTSSDSSLILWSPAATAESSSEDGGSSIWISRQRFGDMGGQRLGGFVSGLWARAGQEALASGWGGGWRRWSCKPPSDGGDEDWTEVPGVCGHRGPVKGLDWSPGGEYLISACLDQTTRIHGAIPIAGCDIPAWHELGRPQIHGYDLLDVKLVNVLKFVSVADEKVARVFEAPLSFVKMMENLNVAKFAPDAYERPVAAAVAPLGLSNKAVSEGNAQPATLNDANPMATRPLEGDLAAVTLWPEIEKIFGHGYELITLAVSNSRRLVATACKATSAEHAAVRMYDTDEWRPVGKPLEGHSLTVTRIAFSPDDRLVLTVSRDRSWRLFEADGDQGGGFLSVATEKRHARIIWDCAWAQEGDIFATASRDKTVKIWKAKENTLGKWVAVATIAIKESGATAVAFAPVNEDEWRRLAIGLETGHILIYRSKRDTPSIWSPELTLDSSTAHTDHVHQLSWRPANDVTHLQLASCSEDGTVKILIV